MKGTELHSLGPAQAPVTLTMYGDFECPYCAEAAEIISDLRDAFGQNLRYVFKHFPLTDIHEDAEAAAQAAEAAGAQGRFWRMHNVLFRHQDDLSVEGLLELAGEIGLDLDRFEADLIEGRFLDRVRADVFEGEELGVDSTPTFFINDVRFEGPTDLEALSTAIQDTLDRERASSAA